MERAPAIPTTHVENEDSVNQKGINALISRDR